MTFKTVGSVIKRIDELAKQGLVNKETADNYIEDLYSHYDKDAYKDMTDEDLINDIKLYGSEI